MESTIYTVAGQTFELQHAGIKGMKWGVRRYQNKDGSLTPAGKKRYSQDKWDTKTARKEYAKLDKAKGEYKHAKKAYDRSFRYAYDKAHAAYSPSAVKRAQNDARWKDATRDAERVKTTKAAYKKQKSEVRKNAPIASKLERGAKSVGVGLASVGTMYLADQVYFGGAGSRAAKAAVSKAYKSLVDQTFKYTLMDASGKVIRRFN